MDLVLEKARTTPHMWEKMRLWIRVLSFMVVVRVEDEDDLFMFEKI